MAFSCEKCVRNLGNKDQTLADLDGSDAEVGSWKCLVSNKKDVFVESKSTKSGNVSVFVFVVLLLCSFGSVDRSSAEDSAQDTARRWKKEVVQSTGRVSGQVNTVVAADIDDDGQMDLVGSFDGKVVLFRGPEWESTEILAEMPADQTGRIAARGCIHSVLLDVDQDGDLDYVGSNRMLFWLECPENPFDDVWVCRNISLDVNGAHCVITGDVNGDGKLDLIANSWRSGNQSRIPDSITWFDVPENPRIQRSWRPVVFARGDAPGGNHYMGFGDLNGDQRPDVACGAKGGPQFPGGEWFAWWEQPQDPDQRWIKHVLSDKEPGASNIVAVDLDDDGVLDLVASRGHGRGVLWFKGPDFEKHDIDASLDTPHSLAVADMDQDGDIDIVACSASLTGQTVVYENAGNGEFTRKVIDQQQSSYDLRLVDMDNDGDIDIVVAGHDSRNLVWYSNPVR